MRFPLPYLLPMAADQTRKRRGRSHCFISYCVASDFPVFGEFQKLAVLALRFIIRKHVHLIDIDVLLRLMNPVLPWFAYSFLAVLDPLTRVSLKCDLSQWILVRVLGFPIAYPSFKRE